MSKMVSKPSSLPWVSPYIMVKDVDAAAAFYEKAFDFKVKEIIPAEDGKGMHAELNYNDQLVMFGRQGMFEGKTLAPASSKMDSPISLYVYTENVDEFYKKAVANSAVGEKEPEDTFWGDRMCVLRDPDGYVWCFATRLEQ